MSEVGFHLLPQDGVAAHRALWAAYGLGHGAPRQAARPRYDVDADPAVSEWGRNAMHAITKNGGFTFHDHVGDGPSDGYMVSVNKEAEKTIPLEDLRPGDIDDFRSLHAPLLQDPANHLGAWVHKGKVFLDVSRHEPDYNRALDLARQHRQLGIYDIANGRTIMTNQAPQQQVAYHHLPSDSLAAVNSLRAAEGLPPLTDESPGVVSRAARLRLLPPT